MAERVQLRHERSGVVRSGFHGFSWTTLFFGCLPALFRSDFVTFIGGLIVYIAIGACTFGLGSIVAGLIWAFMYNGFYTRGLLEKGYVFDDTPIAVERACLKLNIRPRVPQFHESSP